LKTDHKQETIQANQIDDFQFEEEIKNAILEEDVFELRHTLKEIVSQGLFNFSDFEIDQYRLNELTDEQMKEISELVVTDKVMENQLKLHEEIDTAINETDILALRNSLSSIINDEQQISFAEINRIDDYLLEYLNEKDRIEFESLLEENTKLKEETLLHAQINDSIIETDIINLRTNISEIIDENKQSTKIRKFIPDNLQNKPLRYVGVAAAAAAVISAGFFTLSQQKTTSQNLFQQAYHPYDAIGLLRSAPLSNPSFKGIDLYNDRKFDEAIAQFALILKDNDEHPMCNFYTGLCYVEKNNFNKAIMSFQKVIDEKDNLFTEQAEWYMALCLLKTNEGKKSFTILNRIVETKGYYQKDAKELLKKMK
jgi:tetratricopeptide (TPR) repeat protein